MVPMLVEEVEVEVGVEVAGTSMKNNWFGCQLSYFTNPIDYFQYIYFEILVEEKEVVEAACLVDGLEEARRKLLTEIHNPVIRSKNTDLRLIQGNQIII